MTTRVELFDTNSVPFGDLSNNAITPFYKDEKLRYCNLSNFTLTSFVYFCFFILCNNDKNVWPVSLAWMVFWYLVD